MVDVAAIWSIEYLLLALAGGAFGAAIGGLPAFIFTGFMVIAGEAANLAGKAAAGSDAAAIMITDAIAFGPVFGPHISFAAGAAASAYAARRGYMDTDFDYHQAKNINYAFGTKPDVLAVGALFGAAGYVMVELMVAFAMPFDQVAMGVVLSAVLHRVAFGYDVVGTPSSGWLDMKPFEQEELQSPDAVAADGGVIGQRYAVEPWLPQQYKWLNVAVLGVVVGILGAYVGYVSESPYLAFGISAASLIFLSIGHENFPVTHHIALPSSTAVFALAGSASVATVSLSGVVAVGAIFGLISALFGEVFQRVFYAHGDTHLDPPAAAIVFGTFLISVCTALGILPGSGWVPAL
ncbi:hypothetical protein [Natrialba aegyptia]|uniref:DUF7973 domain-containing protein n=1 Tax=Natrialba aegyptia DSM 13077 TaxID=1227491 RepID=M0AJN1_9EURY|nr:hypothetical protein [Natrialba aegyptia]ELY98561.1 hypothetical protein C480_21234 [Natrialba aegyptia DSM 13077]